MDAPICRVLVRFRGYYYYYYYYFHCSGGFLEITLVTRVFGKFGAGDSRSHSHNSLTLDHVNLRHTVTPYWHFNIETHYVISFSLRVTVMDDICGVGCDDFLVRLHVVTM